MLLHTSGRRLKHGNRRYPVIVFILETFLFLAESLKYIFQPYHLGGTQLLAFRHLYPTLLLQFEQYGVHAEPLRPAVGYDVLHGDGAACGLQIMKD